MLEQNVRQFKAACQSTESQPGLLGFSLHKSLTKGARVKKVSLLFVDYHATHAILGGHELQDDRSKSDLTLCIIQYIATLICMRISLDLES